MTGAFINSWISRCITFTTGVAGRATVLTEDDELLFGVTAGEAGGIAAAFPLLLAPLAPLAAPAVTETVNIRHFCNKKENVSNNSVIPEQLTFFGFHVLAVAVGKVILHSALLHSLSIIVIVVVIEPQLLILVQRPSISAISIGE